eukprot:CAMPEP_0179451516 /NCGR_PEP_ID=MMETSP0799-20121207/35583_1 /TAXON_ID=46947 /ORGANISM="Geminigera cryophila, Strain CCMP2564" /LENGTH=51 /DNA_ID=CAMNT_0021246879 /DNA_START=469 /DNA_END=621 /DNA_ORIENTATION=+
MAQRERKETAVARVALARGTKRDAAWKAREHSIADAWRRGRAEMKSKFAQN